MIFPHPLQNRVYSVRVALPLPEKHEILCAFKVFRAFSFVMGTMRSAKTANLEKKGTTMGKQILLINDLPGYGKVALAAMLPILSQMGHHVFNLPTALVSNTLDYWTRARILKFGWCWRTESLCTELTAKRSSPIYMGIRAAP